MQSLTCIEIEYTGLEDWHFYIKDYLADITDDKFDMLSHQKFLFYNFNNYLNLIGEETFTVKHLIIAHNNYALEKMQSKKIGYIL